MVRGLPDPNVDRQDGPAQVYWLPGDAGIGANLETSVRRDDRVRAGPGYLYLGQDIQVHRPPR